MGGSRSGVGGGGWGGGRKEEKKEKQGRCMPYKGLYTMMVWFIGV